MPSKQPPISIRLGKDRAPLVKAYAQEHGKSEGAAILALIDLGLRRITLPVAPKTILAQAEQKAAHLATPAPKRRKWKLDLPVGPTPSPAGSRLKTTGKPKR